jgi:hypothetical protein
MDGIATPRKPDTGRHILGIPVGLFAIIAYKTVWGVLEIGAGLFIFFSRSIFARELTEDPQDLFVNWLLSHTNLTQRGALELGIFVAVLGLGKLLLAFGLSFHVRRTRKIAILFFIAIAVFGLYHLSVTFTAIKVLALAADIAILLYFTFILPRHLGDAGVA